MYSRWRFGCGAVAAGFLACVGMASTDSHSALTGPPNTDETIVMIRHGEKPMSHPSGQLNCQGLNRALALPSVLAKYGRPSAIFAPNPSVQTTEGDPMPFATRYSYVRPLMTIEPYAISLGMPVNAQIGYDHLSKLEDELFKPELSHALVVVSWEHLQARKFAENLLTAFGQNPELAPHWHNNDYDTIYIFHVKSGADGKRKLDFKVEGENLATMLPATCPISPAITSAAPALATSPAQGIATP